jgi:hypothetical protein
MARPAAALVSTLILSLVSGAQGMRFPARSAAVMPPHGIIGAGLMHGRAAAVAMAAGGDRPPNRSAANNPQLTRSDEAGKWLLGAVLLGNLWFFSVPPEIRRAHVCTTDQTRHTRIKVECIPQSEWQAMVSRHYATCKSFGECVHFDFSVDPKTQEFNAKMLGNLRDGKQ